MINDVFLTTTLQDLMDRLQLTGEHLMRLWYSFALDKPKPSVSLPQDEWISAISSLKHEKNIKAKSYVAAFFNGDLKVLDGKDKNHKEVLLISKLHQDQISDVIYTKVSDEGAGALAGKKILVTCSEQPFPELIVSEIDTANGQVKTLGKVNEDLADRLNGWNRLAQNPVEGGLFASCSKEFVRGDGAESYGESKDIGSIQLWKLNDQTLQVPD